MQNEIAQLNLHVAQMVAGQMVATINAERLKVTMEENASGVRVKGFKTNKLIPFSNIQGIDYKLEENND
jgi:hypothetical protein